VVHDYRKLNNRIFELIDEIGQGQIVPLLTFPKVFLTDLNQRLQSLHSIWSPRVCEIVRRHFKDFLDFITAGLPGVFVYLDDVTIVSNIRVNLNSCY
jgi:hypothetical protein